MLPKLLKEKENVDKNGYDKANEINYLFKYGVPIKIFVLSVTLF